MDTNTVESPGHQSQSQYLGNSLSEEEMGHWTPTGIEPTDYDDHDEQNSVVYVQNIDYAPNYKYNLNYK